MNFKNRFRKVGALALAISALGVSTAIRARAEGSPQSFGATNVLASAIVLTTYPTNSSGTNTGGPININNYERVGFYFTGNVLTVSTGTVTLVRSPLGTSPSSYTNWETVATKTLTIPMASTGPFMWVTNLDTEFVRPGLWVGISVLTNSVGVVSNLDIGLTKKIIPPGSK
jgi:hypothetical protein